MDCIKIKQTYHDVCQDKPVAKNPKTLSERPLQCVEIIQNYISCTTNRRDTQNM